MLKKIGRYDFKVIMIDLYIDTELYGAKYRRQEGEPTVTMVIGVDAPWPEVVVDTVHEALELAFQSLNARLVPDFTASYSSDRYIFHCTHPQFAEICGYVGQFLTEALPDLSKAYKKYHRR